ncbi:MAG: FAD-dependent oxidoreductase [Acidobacteriota bacterium]
MSAGSLWDVAVIGGGAMGAAAADALAARGRRVVLLERQDAPGHGIGSSHGDGRIVRACYPEPFYVAMAQQAMAMWRALDDDGTLLAHSGGLDLGEADGTALADLRAALDDAGLRYAWLDAEATQRRWPHLRLPDDSAAIHQPDTMVVRAGAAVARWWSRIETSPHGAVRRCAAATEITVDARSVRIRLDDGDEIRASALVIAAGSWSRALLAQLGVDLALRVTREHIAYFPVRDDAPAAARRIDPSALPTVIDHHGVVDARHFYALPQIDVPGVKAAWHHDGVVLDGAGAAPNGADAACDPRDAPAFERARLAPIQRWLRARWPGLDDTPIEATTCLYTSSIDHHFVIDRVPGVPRPVAFAAGFSGHGFKFAPLIGALLAALSLDEAPPADPTPFALARFAADAPAVAPRVSA